MYKTFNIGSINDIHSKYPKKFKTLALKISQHYGTTFHTGWKLQDIGCNHHWVVDGSGKEVFNASGLGYKGRGC